MVMGCMNNPMRRADPHADILFLVLVDVGVIRQLYSARSQTSGSCGVAGTLYLLVVLS